MTDVSRAARPESDRAYLHYLAREYLRGRRGGPVEVSDVVQQALLKAHRKREQFRGGTDAEWRAWLRRVLANVIADAHRAAPRERAVCGALDASASRLENLLPRVDSTPSLAAQREERLAKLAGALDTLSEDERIAIHLRYFEDPPWPLSEIARRLKRPTAKSVAGLLARGLQKLRQQVGDAG
jgi:RNA polymerase sigma-70 factor (ECF subfamily)